MARERRRRGRPAHDGLLTAIAEHWAIDDPWQPGFDVDFTRYGRKDVDRFGRIHYDGPTWLDSLVILADEALQIAIRTK